ncbi:hypothetical protein [Sulfuracidifex tepidarius]|nr:hypothetical protein [Sulfuracidifex tepidarius]
MALAPSMAVASIDCEPIFKPIRRDYLSPFSPMMSSASFEPTIKVKFLL